MELAFKLNGEAPEGKPGKPSLGIIEGYIQEGINQVSFIELILVCNQALDEKECASYIGQKATIGLGDTIDGDLLWSRFDGIVYEVHVLDSFGLSSGMFKYQMMIRPALWNLNYMIRAQSFPDKTRITAVKETLEFSFVAENTDYKIVFKDDDPDKYPKCKQILQNKISDLDFVQNLLTEAGVNYFFCAEKDGKSQEYMKLIDNQVQFLNPFKKNIPYNPGSGLAGSNYRIDWLEIHHRASVTKAYATANLGDGKVQVFENDRPLVNDKENAYSYLGMYCSYGCEGEREQIAKQSTSTRGQYFTSSRVTYEGRSNHFIIRPGEKISIGDETGTKVLHEVLMTTVFHHFRQTPNSATHLQADQHPEYGNLFTAVTRLADYRPDQTFGKTVTELKRVFTEEHSLPGVSAKSKEAISRTDLADVEKFQLKKQIADLTRDLAVAKELSGLMVGEVIEAASVTAGNELVCKVKNEKFFEGVTVKVALGWLTQHGWLYVLPRVGMQVYFQFINGEGGQNEAVMVGYRPTETRPVLDPEKTTDCTQLGAGKAPDPGKPIDKAVGSSKFSPANKYRNALMGENGVAEVAVIDGGEDSVYVNADNRICLISKKSVSVSTGSLCESAGSLSQQMGAITQKVTKNKNVTVDGNFERIVQGTTTETTKGAVKISSTSADVDIASTSAVVDILGSTKVNLHDGADASVAIYGNNIVAAQAKGGNELLIVPGGITGNAGSAHMYIGKDKNATLKVGDNFVEVETAAVEIKCGGSTIVVKGDSITVEGKNVTVNGSTEGNYNGGGATIKGSGGTLKLNGSVVKLNC
jgi:uncharacterized protein involved in type VI secretion and phage assembly